MSKESFESHLGELRDRLKHSLVVLIILTAFGFYFSTDILSWFQGDLMVSLHALAAYEVLYTRLLIAFLFGFFLSLPILLFHCLKFAQPGLREDEYRLIRNYLPFSLLLFSAGPLFAYEYIVKTSLQFFISTTGGADVEAVWGLQNTIGFALKLSAFTGVFFQLPIVSLVLSKAGVIDSEIMRSYRPHFFVMVLLCSAVATPPDIVSQLLLTAPVILLYQLSIFLVGRTESSGV